MWQRPSSAAAPCTYETPGMAYSAMGRQPSRSHTSLMLCSTRCCEEGRGAPVNPGGVAGTVMVVAALRPSEARRPSLVPGGAMAAVDFTAVLWLWLWLVPVSESNSWAAPSSSSNNPRRSSTEAGRRFLMRSTVAAALARWPAAAPSPTPPAAATAATATALALLLRSARQDRKETLMNFMNSAMSITTVGEYMVRPSTCTRRRSPQQRKWRGGTQTAKRHTRDGDKKGENAAVRTQSGAEGSSSGHTPWQLKEEGMHPTREGSHCEPMQPRPQGREAQKGISRSDNIRMWYGTHPSQAKWSSPPARK